jgi:anti-sigma-K factor RskA
MFSQLRKITDERAMLLLYLAGELSSSDRQEVERRLGSDPRLAALLADVRADYAAYMETMSILDAAMPAAVSESAAAQRANRAMRQWATRRLAHPLPPRVKRGLIPQWVYPMATAAGIVVAVIVWGVAKHNEYWFKNQPLAVTDDKAINTLLSDPHENPQDLIDAAVNDDDTPVETDAAAQSVAGIQTIDDINTDLGLAADSNRREGAQ